MSNQWFRLAQSRATERIESKIARRRQKAGEAEKSTLSGVAAQMQQGGSKRRTKVTGQKPTGAVSLSDKHI